MDGQKLVGKSSNEINFKVVLSRHILSTKCFNLVWMGLNISTIIIIIVWEELMILLNWKKKK